MKYKTITLEIPEHGLFALCFVISPEGNFIIKGEDDICRKYINQHYPVCIFRQERYQKTRHWGLWRANGFCLFHRNHGLNTFVWTCYNGLVYPFENRSSRFVLTNRDMSKGFSYRRLPKKWLPEWNQLLQK